MTKSAQLELPVVKQEYLVIDGHHATLHMELGTFKTLKAAKEYARKYKHRKAWVFRPSDKKSYKE